MKLIHKQLFINPVSTYESGGKTKGITRTVGPKGSEMTYHVDPQDYDDFLKGNRNVTLPETTVTAANPYADNQHIFEDGGEYGNGGKMNKYSFMDKLKMSMMNTIPLIPDPTTFNAPFDNVTGNVNDRSSSVAQVSYLLSRDKQQKLFEDYGYKRVYNDYGTVKRAAESKGYPIYQKNSDDASRENLVPIGNADSDPFEVETTYKGKLMEVPTNWYAAPNKSLIEAGATRSTIYYNPDNGKYYQKAWDLNDYGGNGGSTADIFGKFLDTIGNPVVVTSGIQEVLPENINKVEKNYMLPYAKKHYLKKTDNGHWGYVAPDVIIYGHKHADGGFKDGGKMYDDGGVISSNGQYHVNPTDYLDVLSNVENNKPVEVTLPDVTVKAADPKNYRSSFHSEDIFPFMNVATAGLLNRGSLSLDLHLLKDTYDAATGNKSWKDVANSAILGNSGVFKNPWANLALDIVVPTTSVGIYNKLAPLKNIAKNSTLVDYVTAMKNYKKLGAEPVTINEADKLHYPDYIMPLYKIRLPKEVKEFYPEMLRRIKDNFNVDSKDLTESFSKQSETPIYIGKYDDPRYSGTHMMNTGESYVSLNDPDPISTAFHEAARHGTEDALLKYVPKAWRGYTDFIDALRPHMGHLITESSKDPAELRATLGELYLLVHKLVKLAYKNHASKLPAEFGDKSINLYERFGDITNHNINDILTDDDLLSMLELTNAYGLDYANTLKAIKKYSSIYRKDFLDNLEIISLLLLQLKQPNISKEEVKEISDRIQFSDFLSDRLRDSAQEYPKAMAKLRELLTKYPMFTGAAAIGTGYGMTKHKNGGKMKIHIKKKNRGKFTSYCGGKVTQACIDKAKASGNSKLVKRAVFAENVRKWKH